MTSAVSIHPQVLFNISSHILSNHVNNANSKKQKQLGLLLGKNKLKYLKGTYNTRFQTIDIVDSFELLYNNDKQLDVQEVTFLKDRMELRLKGDQWNLFKSLDIVGWYKTQHEPEANDLLLHAQLTGIVDQYTPENQVNIFRLRNFLQFQGICFVLISTQKNKSSISGLMIKMETPSCPKFYTQQSRLNKK